MIHVFSVTAFASLLIKGRLSRDRALDTTGHSLGVDARSSRPAHQPVRVANVGRVAHGDLALDVRATLRAIPCRPICTSRRTRLLSRPCAALGRHSVSTAKYNLEYEHYLRHRIESGLACPHLALRSLSHSSGTDLRPCRASRSPTLASRENAPGCRQCASPVPLPPANAPRRGSLGATGWGCHG